MTNVPQVAADSYDFRKYVTKPRWISFWHQIDEVVRLSPDEVLEVGVGNGIFSTLIRMSGIELTTVDIDSDLNPDYVSSLLNLPFHDGKFDVSVCFQTLEHMPFDESIAGFRELIRVSKRFVIVSLPDVTEVWRYSIRLPRIGDLKFTFRRPFHKRLPAIKNGNHYWEIGRVGYSVREVLREFERQGVTCIKNFQVFENPYHRFMIFEINDPLE